MKKTCPIENIRVAQILALILALFACSSKLNADDNILFVILDDWGVDASPIDNPAPSRPLAKMPNLQALADGGLRFTRAYSNPACSPTRASLMTGRYAHQTGIYTPPDADKFSVDELALPEAMTAANTTYAMAMMGKWHLGGELSLTGYETVGGWPEFYGTGAGDLEDYFSWTKNTNGRFSLESNYATTEHVDEAIAFIDRSESGAEPWFCWLAFNAPHSPYHNPPADLAPEGGYSVQVQGETDNQWKYRKMLEAADTELGRLLSSISLDETNVILIGDNGSANEIVQEPYGDGHAKGDLYEGGIHIPMVVNGPAVLLPGGSTTDKLVHVVDIYPTILELAGIDPATVAPADVLAQTNSIVPILNGSDQADRAMIAEGNDTPWRGRAIIMGDFPDYKLIIYGDPEDADAASTQEFYHLATDANEQEPLNTARLRGIALNAYNACVAKDTEMGGGYTNIEVTTPPGRGGGGFGGRGGGRTTNGGTRGGGRR